MIENELKRKEKRKAPTKPWVDLFEKNIYVANGMSLSYIPPILLKMKAVIQLNETEMEKGNKNGNVHYLHTLLGKTLDIMR